MNSLFLPLWLMVLAASPADGEPVGTLKVDPVELVFGKEVPGKEEFSATHYRYRYLFSSEENKAKFEKEPEKYEIQLGGACARMGALSGLGTTDIFASYKGKIYIFASESCRKTFLENPYSVLEGPDDVPRGRPMDMRRGQALLYRVLTRMGGPERVIAIKNYQFQRTKKIKIAGKSVDVVETITLEFPSTLRRDYVRGKDKSSTVVTKKEAWQAGPSGTYDLHAQQRDAALRTYFGHNLLALLKARKQPGVRVYHSASVPIEYKGQRVQLEEVKIHAYGATCTLGIEPTTGRVLRMSYRGWGPDEKFGEVEKTFYDFQDIDGIMLPTSYTTRFNWKPVEKKDKGKVTQKVDVKLADGFFEKPKTKPVE